MIKLPSLASLINSKEFIIKLPLKQKAGQQDSLKITRKLLYSNTIAQSYPNVGKKGTKSKSFIRLFGSIPNNQKQKVQ